MLTSAVIAVISWQIPCPGLASTMLCFPPKGTAHLRVQIGHASLSTFSFSVMSQRCPVLDVCIAGLLKCTIVVLNNEKPRY